MNSVPITWVLERDVFPRGDCIRDAAQAAGHKLIEWSDDWWFSGIPALEVPVVFHGGLGNADRLAYERIWTPGAFCQTSKFCCSAWYDAARQWLLHANWEILPAAQFVAEPSDVLAKVGAQDAIFVRPDSPLKPFAGRVLQSNQISLAALDFGFYFDDPNLPVVVAPVRNVQREWRYVVADRQVIAGSAYVADLRQSTADDPQGAPWQFAQQVADLLPPPELIYVLDVCEADGELRLLELNPFSGADLYACVGADVVRRVAAAIHEFGR